MNEDTEPTRSRLYGRRGRIDSRRARYWLRKFRQRKPGGSVRRRMA